MTADPDFLRGSIVPLVTPFMDGAVDYDAFERSVERQVNEGSHGVVVTGTTGEPTSLTVAERTELTRRAVATAAGRIPVVAATGSANHAETLELTRAGEQAGADAVLVVCPAFVKPSQEGLVEHFASAAGATGLPFLIYNIPGRSGVGVTAESVARVRERVDNLVGIKHASNDADLVTELLQRLGSEFRIFCGLESYSYPFLALGAAGTMSAVGNLLPRRVAELPELVWQGDHEGALRIPSRAVRGHQDLLRNEPGAAQAHACPAGHRQRGGPSTRPRQAPTRAGASSRSSAASRRRPRTGSHERHRDRPMLIGGQHPDAVLAVRRRSAPHHRTRPVAWNSARLHSKALDNKRGLSVRQAPVGRADVCATPHRAGSAGPQQRKGEVRPCTEIRRRGDGCREAASRP